MMLLSLLAGAIPASAQQAPAEATPPTTVDASRGGITITSGVNSLTIGVRTQLRWTLDDREALDADTEGAGAGEADGPLSQFDVPRLRLLLNGTVYRRWLRYNFQFELHRTSGEGGSRMKDAFVEIRPPDRSYRLQVGQFKVPFGLQQLNSSSRLQFVDRAITDAKFNPARDLGVMVAGTLLDRKAGYEAGVFNGAGESTRQTNRSHAWAARAFIDPLGQYTLSEGGSDATDRPVLHVGGAVRGGEPIRGRAADGIVEDADRQHAVNVETAFKMGRLSATAEHFWMSDEQDNPLAGRDIDARGYHAQAGYMVLPRTTEIAVLYSRVDGDTAVPDSAVTELRGVVGYFFQSHNLKLQGDAGRIAYGAGFALMPPRARQGLPSIGTRLVTGEELSDVQVRVQLSLAF
jgi:phosphate-selective porin